MQSYRKCYSRLVLEFFTLMYNYQLIASLLLILRRKQTTNIITFIFFP